MVKSILKLSALSALVVLAAACSSGAAEPDEPVVEDFQTSEGTTGAADSSQARARLGEGDVPVQTQLILGTLQLETTDLAVDSVQAAELAPLWKAMRSLTTSDTAAAAEIEALLDQIQDVMTTEQLEAISAFEITPEDMRTIIQDLGIEFGPPEGFDGEGFDPDQFRQQFGGEVLADPEVEGDKVVNLAADPVDSRVVAATLTQRRSQPSALSEV